MESYPTLLCIWFPFVTSEFSTYTDLKHPVSACGCVCVCVCVCVCHRKPRRLCFDNMTMTGEIRPTFAPSLPLRAILLPILLSPSEYERRSQTSEREFVGCAGAFQIY